MIVTDVDVSDMIEITGASKPIMIALKYLMHNFILYVSCWRQKENTCLQA